jgi:hypothetical protein
MKKNILLYAYLLVSAFKANGQTKHPLPIIDMHLHAIPVNAFGPPPVTLGAPFKFWGSTEPGEDYEQTFNKALQSGNWNQISVVSPMTDDELEAATINILRKRNIYGVLSGSVKRVKKWQNAEPKRIIESVYWDFDHLKSEKLDIDSLRHLSNPGNLQISAR